MTRFVRYDDLEFEADPGITGFGMAPVLDDAAATVKFWRVPAGWNLGRLGIEENLHYHRRAFEYSAVLQGRFPHIEYDEATDSTYRMHFRTGDLMIRPSGSVHGLHRDMPVPERCDMLYWTTGSGTSIRDADYATETTDVLGDLAAHRAELGGRCRITNVLEHPASGTRTMSAPGEPFGVELVQLPAGATLRLDGLCDSTTLFAFLWSGRCRHRRGEAQPAVGVPRWTMLVGAPQNGDVDATLTADEDACWLRVSRAGARA